VDLQDGRAVSSSSREDDGSHAFEIVDIKGPNSLAFGARGLHEVQGAGGGGGGEEGVGSGGGGGGGREGGRLVVGELLYGVVKGLGRADIAGKDDVLRKGGNE